MFLTSIQEYKNALLPSAIVKAIDETLDLLAKNNNTLEIGAYELQNGAKALVSKYTTKEYDNCPYETHNIMADIQMLIAGEEFLDYRPNENLTPVDEHYDPRQDLVLYKEKPIAYSRTRLMQNVLCILLPNEAHAPSICIDNPSEVHKIVIKVPMNTK